MSKLPSAFENYGEMSKSGLHHTIQAGRYLTQEQSESLIIDDVRYKLDLSFDRTLLEIGCGPGNLLIPLSFFAKSSMGIDHPAIIEKASSRFSDVKIEWIGGQFPVKKPDVRFDRILIYNVIHHIDTIENIFEFIDQAASLLSPRGKMLVGDIPNRDRKRRFVQSDFGREFDKEWQSVPGQTVHPLPANTSITFLSDTDVLELLKRFRANGFDADILPQPAELPFGNTREDILIRRP